MGWTEFKVQEGDEEVTIEIFNPHTIKEAVEFSFSTAYAFDPENWNNWDTLLGALGVYSRKDPFEPELSLILGTVLGLNGGFLPIDSTSYELISALDKPTVAMTDAGTSMLAFVPAEWLRFFRNGQGIEYIELNSQGPFTPTATNPSTSPPTLPDYYLIIRDIPLLLIDPHGVRGLNWVSGQYYDVVKAVFAPILLMAGTDPQLVEKALNAVMAYVYNTNQIPSPTAVSLNPLRLFPAIKEGNEYLPEEMKLKDYELEEIKNRLSSYATTNEENLIDAGVFPLTGLFPPAGRALAMPTRYKEELDAFFKLSQAFNDAQAKGELKPGDLWKYLNLSYALLLPATIDYLDSTLEGAIANATNSNDPSAKRALHYLTALRDWLNTARYAIPTDLPQKVQNDPLGTMRSYQPNVPVMGVIYLMNKIEFWIPAQILSADKSLVALDQFIDRDVFDRIAEKTPLADFLGRIQDRAEKFAETLANLLNLTTRVQIDRETVYHVQLNGKDTTVQGPSAVVNPEGDHYRITYLIPLRNACPFTNVFLYRWTENGYMATPMNPNDPKSPLDLSELPNECSQMALTIDELLNKYGGGQVADVREEGLWPIVAIVAIAIAIYGLNAIGLIKFGSEATSAYQSSIRLKVIEVQTIGQANEYQYKLAKGSTDLASLFMNLAKIACEKNPDLCDDALKDSYDVYMKNSQTIENSQKNITNGVSTINEIDKRAHEEYEDLMNLYGQLIKLMSPSNLAKYLLYIGAFVAGIAVIPVLTQTLATSLLTRPYPPAQRVPAYRPAPGTPFPRPTEGEGR